MRAAYYGNGPLTGSGQCVGLAEFDGYDISDVVSTFNNSSDSAAPSGSNYLLTYYPPGGGPYTIPINNDLVNGGTVTPLSGDIDGEAEVVLDIAQAVGMAPGISQLRVYIAPDAWTASGSNEFPSSNDDTAVLNQIASEDVCNELSMSWNWRPENPLSDPDEPIFEQLQVQGQSFFNASGDSGSWITDSTCSDGGCYVYPEESPNVTAVGGTILTTNGPDGSWSSESGWSNSGGGISPDGFPLPSYQSGLDGINSTSTVYRNAPDLAMEANWDNYVCNFGSCSGDWGGTSFAAPRWAGFMALANQQATANGQSSIGFINPLIYPIGESSKYLTDFNEIVGGSNGGYSVVTGEYNMVTGWGSPNGQNLINDLASPPTAATPYESNVNVQLNGGYPPTSINYFVTFQDDTPGATIHYQVTICNSPYSWATTTPGSQVDFYNPCPDYTPYGTMYATAPGYQQSSPTSMSF